VNTYRFIADPDHGWIEVTALEVHRLGIAGRISTHSYMSRDGKLVYLEEDVDAGHFFRAKERFSEPVALRDEYDSNRSTLRTLPRFDARRLDLSAA
jgi:hypothetical protein